MVSRQDFTSTFEVDDPQRSILSDHPAVMLPDASFLYHGSFEKVGFDLVITNAEGTTFVVEDYFSFIPPPNLMLPNGAGLSPEMVAAKLHLPFEEVMFAGPANSANALEEIGKVTLVLGDVRVKRMGANGNIEELQLKRGDTLYEGDELTTGARSFIKARMLDGTRFHLGKSANAVLTDFVYNESERQGNFEAFVQRGGFHYKSGKIGKMFEGLAKNHSTISTPSAMIGIRGSELDGHVDEQGNTLIRHTSGELAVMDINGLSETLLTDPGNTSLVTINGANTRFETPTSEQEAIFEVVLPPPDTPEAPVDVEPDASQEDETSPPEGDQVKRPEEGAPPEAEQEVGEGETAEVDEAGAEETEEGAEAESAGEEVAEKGVPEDETPEETSGEQSVEAVGSQEEGATEEGPAEESAGESPSANDALSANREPSGSIEEPAADTGNGDGRQEPQNRIAGEQTNEPDQGVKPSTEGQTVAQQDGQGEKGEIAQREAGTNSDGAQQSVRSEDAGSLSGRDSSVEGPSGVTIRESSFGDANTNIVGTENEVVTGSVEPTTAGSGARSDQQVAGNELEILDVLANEENEQDARVEDRQNEQEPTREELPPDNPPIARDDVLEVKDAGAREVTNLLLNNDNDSDIGQAPKLAQIEGAGSQGGRIEFSDGAAVYIPNPDRLDALRAEETATETFSYRIVSGDLTDTATLTVRLVGTNLAPIAEDDKDETIEDVAITIDVLANDGDPDGDTLTIVSVDNQGAFGDVVIAGDGKGLIYNPPDGLQAGQVGEDIFTYQVSDGQFTATATITVTVVGRNDPPVINATGEPVEISAGGGAVTIPLNEIFVDSDLGDQLEVVSVDTSNTKGVVTIGSIIYDDNGVFDFLKPGETATDTFGVTARDQFGGEGSGFYTVVINGVNDAPNAQNDSYFAVAGEPLVASGANSLLGNDSDPEGTTLTVLVSKTQGPQFGELNLLPNGNFEYIPGADFGGNDSFMYTVSDGELTDTAIVNIVVDLVNDVPITAPDFYTVSADGSVIGNVLDNDFDPEGQQLTAQLVESPSSGTVTLAAGGLFEYTPSVAPDGTIQSDSFVYVAIDPQGRESVETVTINTVEDNQPPQLINPIPDTIVPVGVTSSIDLNTYFADPEGTNLEFAFTSSAGTASFTLIGSTLSVTPPAAAEGETVNVEIAASDGQNITTDQFILTVGLANQAPVVDNPLGNQNVTAFVFLNENIDGVFSDPDPDDVLTFSLNTNAPFLGLSGTFLQGSPSAADVGTYTVQLTASDSAGATVTETFTLTVSAPPPPPVNNPSVAVSGDQATGTATNTLSATLLASDPEGLAAINIYAINSPGTFGTPTIDPNTGVWSYVVDGSGEGGPIFTGTDVFTVDVTDATGDVTTIPISILIRPVDTPGSIIGSFTHTTTETVPYSNALVLSDSDGLAANNPYFISTPPSNGMASIDASGNWLYTPDNGYTGPDSFVVTALDGFNYTTTQSISLTVNPLPAPNNPASGGPSITGNTEFGNVLTANIAGITDPDGTSGATYFYEWFVDGVSVAGPGTITTTYTTTIADVGKPVTLEVTFTDDLGFGEILQDTVLILPQSNSVTGTASYTFVPSFVDDVFGGPGNDTITAVGAAESGDIIDLDSGFDTLTLDDVPNVIEIEGVESLLGGSQTDTITLYGNLNTLNGLLSNLENSDTVYNEAFITLDNETVIFGGIGGEFENKNNGHLQIGGSIGSSVNLQNFSFNYGTVILDGGGTSTLTVQLGNFNQQGNFIVQGPGSHEFDGQFYLGGGGSLIIDTNFTILPGGQIDLTFGGSFFINGGSTLTFDNSRLYADNTVFLSGSPSESIMFVNGAIFDADGYFYGNSGPVLDFDGSVTVNGTLNVGENTFLTLTGDTFNGTLNNQGYLDIRTTGPSSINQLFNGVSGVVQLTSNAADSSSVLTVTTNVTNNGTIELDNADNTTNLVSTLNVGGTLTNVGTIHARDDDESLTAGRHTINGRVVDNGEIVVHAELELSGVSADHDFSGKIELRENSGNGYGGDLYISSANSVDFLPGSKLFGQGGITSNVGITHMGGEIEPDDLGAAGTITFNSGLDLSPSSVVLLDIFDGTGTNQDLIVVNGLLDVEGTIQLTFHDTSLILGGTTIEDVMTFSSIANATFDNVVHNLGSGFNVSLVSDGSNLDVVITQGFENFADNSNLSFDWSNGGAWNGGLPTNTQDVLIDNHDVDFLGGSEEVQSLTVINSILDVSGGELDLNNESLIDGTSILNVGGTGTLQVDGRLIIDGQINLNAGKATTTATMTTTSVIDILGMGTIDASGSPEIEIRIHNQGSLSLIGSGSLMGNQPIENSSIFSVNPSGNVNLDVPIENQDGGLIDVGSLSATVMITHSQTVDNFENAVYRLDTPGASGESTNVQLNNATFSNQGFLQVLDTGASGGSRFFDLNGFTFNNAQGNLDIQADVTFDVEGGLFDQQDGEIYIATSINLNIDGGTGGDIHLNSGSRFAGDGNINFLNNVTLTLMGDLFLNSNTYFDTSAGDVTFTGPHTLFLDGGTTLSLHDNDVITTSALDNKGSLSLQGNNITIGALLSNFGNLNVIGDSGGGLKTFTSGFSNDGSVTLDIAAGETNTLSIGGQLINSFSGFLDSNDGGGATNPNILQADLQNFGTVNVNHDLTLDASGVGSHDNFASLHIAPGATLTIGVNDSFENFYDDSGSASGSITGGGILDVSGTGVTFVNDGLLMPGGFSATDIFTIQTNANTQFGPGSVVEIDLSFDTPGSGHDQLVFSGAAPDLNGRLRLNPLISPSGSYTIITATSFGGLFSMIEGTDLYAMGGDVFDVTVSATDITVTTVTPDLTGTPGDDGSLDATGATVIHADGGNDVIFNVSLGDTVFAGEGNDVIIGDIGLKRVDGGAGVDTLTLTNNTLNFMGIDGYRIESIEVLGLEGNGAQTVTLDAMSIRNIVDEENDLTFSEGSLVVYGDASDHLILIGDYNPVGNDFFDIRSAGNFEEYLRLEQNSTSTGTTSVYIDNQMSAEVIRLDGSKDIYGSAGDDDISSGGDIVATANDDVIDGRDGNDFIDGLGGDDSLFGGHGNDTIVRDIADTGIVDGGDGFDTLLDDSPGATINLNGVANLQNFERVDMADGDGNDLLSIDLAGLGNIIGDNSLESLLPDGQLKFIVDGDAGDQFNLSGIGVHSTSIAALGAAGWVTNGAELDYLGTGTNYLKLTNGAIDIYVHEDVANVI